MSTFFAVVFTNILIGAVLYLVISLKLEKTSSAFFSRKLKKEMDEIINEFNETAERNISILENRISLMKKILEKASVEGVDLTINEEIFRMETEKKDQRKKAVFPSNTIISSDMGKLNNVKASLYAKRKEPKLEVRIDETVSSFNFHEDEELIDDPDIYKAYEKSEDKAGFVSRLHSNGWTENEIVRQCQITPGELKLMLNLRAEL
ncbi:MAG TPA: hypothetical protein PLM72_01750 [Spirochaetota bacterium]|nr:hypothetical protein [Spirochaetota bacterium]HQO21783.1 hypothetical protein [Spirochaetota bacterium]